MSKFVPIKFFFAFSFLTLFLFFISSSAILRVSALSADSERIKQSDSPAPLSRENSAHLARVLQLRQNRGALAHRKNDENGRKIANAKANNGKPKRYKCFLVDDDNDSEESLSQQKSYFAKFQDRNFAHQKSPADILGWEESPRRSAGVAAGPRYLYASTKGTTTIEPIIEYIDDDDVDEAEETDTSVPQQRDTTQQSNNAATLAPSRTTISRARTAPKQRFNNMPKAEAAPEGGGKTTKMPVDGSLQQEEEDYGEKLGEDLYIATTTHKFIQQEPIVPTTTNRPQAKMPVARSIPGTVFDGGTNKIEDERPAEDRRSKFIPEVKIKTSMRPFNVPMSTNKAEMTQGTMRENEMDKVPIEEGIAKETQEQKGQQQLIRITPLRREEADQQTDDSKPKQQEQQHLLVWHQLQTNNKQKDMEGAEQQMMAPAQNVPYDSQGRPLILSPEHCKMVDHYSSLYGVKDVRSFVHSNCAFAKMYLPTATCAEIDILVSSCYQARNDRQQKEKRRHH